MLVPMRAPAIGATLGPASADLATMRRMIASGMAFARLNLSHGDPASHRTLAARLRRAAGIEDARVALVADLQGPRLRIGVVRGGSIVARRGEEIVIRSGARVGRAGELPLPWRGFAGQVRAGDAIVLDHGRVRLRAVGFDGPRLRCVVTRGGAITTGRGVNVPRIDLAIPSLTPKDRRDLGLVAELGAEVVLASFVRGPEDVSALRRALRRSGSRAGILAKIEHRIAVRRIREILHEADGVLVARGDLTAELGARRVPGVERRILAAAQAAGKPAWVATHLLDSMVTTRHPTRREIAGIRRALREGAAGLLLTTETAVGRYPALAVAALSRAIGPSGPGWWS